MFEDRWRIQRGGWREIHKE